MKPRTLRPVHGPARLRAAVSAMLLGLAGCTADEGNSPPAALQPDTVFTASPTDASGLQTLRGHFTYGHEERTFQPCGSGSVLWTTDRTGLLAQLHDELRPGVKPYEAVFAVVRGTTDNAQETGFAADYDGDLVVTDVLYAAHEGLGCDSDWTFRYRAAGNEPFWNLTVTVGGIRLMRPGEPDRTWLAYRIEPEPDGVRIIGSGDTTTAVHVEIRRRACRDSMSGAFSSFTVLLALGDLSFSGCAAEGVSGEGD